VLNNFQINSQPVWDCHQSLVKLAEHNRVQLILLPGNKGTDGNEKADQLAKEGSSYPLKGPWPALGISTKVAKGVIRDWKHGCLYTDKGKLKAFLKTLSRKKLVNCSV
jgi:ribonuclease HI